MFVHQRSNALVFILKFNMKLFFALVALHFAFTEAMFNSEQMINMPYYAYVTFSSPQMSFYGGGALISNLHVLTNGANIQSFNAWRVGLGSNRRSSHRTFNTNRALAHPNYSESNNVRQNDIGIIFMNLPIELNVNIFPIFLPSLNTKAHPFLNVQGMVLGFAGSTTIGNEGLENLQAAHVRAISHSTCLQHYPMADINQHFCAADDSEQRSNFCLGDQGGAFAIMSRDEEYLVGIASLPGKNILIWFHESTGLFKGCTTIPSLYVRIGSFRQWIQSETGI